MKTIIEVARGGRVSVWSGDLPVLAEGQRLRLTDVPACRVDICSLDLGQDPPVQKIVAR